jgi:hypothetical protein
MTHRYKRDTVPEEEAFQKMMQRIREDIRQTHRRRFSTYQEAFETYGLKPKTMHVTDIMRDYADSVWENAWKKVAFNAAATYRNADATPILLPMFDIADIEKRDPDAPDFKVVSFLDDRIVKRMIEHVTEIINNERRDAAQAITGRQIEQVQRRLSELANRLAKPERAPERFVGATQKGMERVGETRKELEGQLAQLLHEQMYPVYNQAVPNWRNPSGLRVEFNRWVEEFHPAQRGYVNLASKLPSTSALWVHPDSVNQVRWINDRETKGLIIDKVSELNQWSKYATLNLSLFHPASLLESYLAAFGIVKAVTMSANPVGTFMELRAAIKKIKAGGFDMDVWRLHGMQDKTSPDVQMNVVDKRIHDWIQQAGPDSGLAAGLKTWAKWNDTWNNWLWNEVQPAMKILTAERLHMEMKNNYRSRGIDWDDDVLMDEVANLTNQMYGGQEWATYKWTTPKRLQAMHLGIFAPDWTISALHSTGISSLPPLNHLLGYNMTPNQLDYIIRKNWPGMGIMLLGIPNFMQAMVYMAGGDPDKGDKMFTWENEQEKRTSIDLTPALRHLGWVPVVGYEGGDSGARRVYLRWGKQAWEVLDGWLTQPVDTFLNKTSSGVRTAYEQITGTNTAGWQLPFAANPGILGGLFSANGNVTEGRLSYVAQKFMPMSLLSVLQGRPSSFFAPSSRGTSIGTATAQMTQVLQAYGDPSTWRTITEKKLEPRLDALGAEIMDAAERNGVDSEEVLNRARVRVLAGYYGEFFKAIDKDRPQRMEQMAQSIVRMHGTLQGLLQSMNRRRENLHRQWTTEDAARAKEAFESAFVAVQ